MSAVDAAAEVARAHGLRCDDPIVLCDAWYVFVHFRPDAAPALERQLAFLRRYG
jgi:hypothetical protein